MNQRPNATKLLASDMIKFKNDWISFSAVNTRMRLQVVEN